MIMYSGLAGFFRVGETFVVANLTIVKNSILRVIKDVTVLLIRVISIKIMFSL